MESIINRGLALSKPALTMKKLGLAGACSYNDFPKISLTIAIKSTCNHAIDQRIRIGF